MNKKRMKTRTHRQRDRQTHGDSQTDRHAQN